jgi:hypothetical protein
MAREHLYPIVVFKKLEKLKVEDDCGMPVVEGGIAATQEIHRHHDVVLTLEQIETLCLAIKHAKPLATDITAPVLTSSEKPGEVEERITKGGRRFVRVHGTKEQTQAIARLREKQGQHSSDVKQDQKDVGVCYFYLTTEKK